MTENMREEILKDIRDGYIDEWDNLTLNELFATIEKEYEEVQEYRAIGTIAEFKHYKHIVHISELAIDSIEKEKETIRSKTIDEVISKILPYGSFCVEWNEGMTKEEIAESVINQAKEQFIDVLEEMRGAGNE